MKTDFLKTQIQNYRAQADEPGKRAIPLVADPTVPEPAHGAELPVGSSSDTRSTAARKRVVPLVSDDVESDKLPGSSAPAHRHWGINE